MSGFSIDHQFARFGSTRFATDKITSFVVTTESRKVQGSNDKASSIIIGIVAVLIGLALLSAGAASSIIGVAITGYGCWSLWKARGQVSTGSHDRTMFKLSLVTNAGEVAAYETTSSSEMTEIEAALEQAIVDSRK